MAEAYQPRGKYFADFQVGTELVSAGRTITEADIVQFGTLTGDFNPMHMDAEYARAGMFGERLPTAFWDWPMPSGWPGSLACSTGRCWPLRKWSGSSEARSGLAIRYG